MEVLQAINAISDPLVARKMAKALAILKRTFALYPLSKIAFSFNGGKDSTVILHLLRAALAQHGDSLLLSDDVQGLHGIRSFYFVREEDFSEVHEFVQKADEEHSLQVDYLQDADFKRGLEKYITTTGVMAIILGTRRGDPNAGDQEFFCPSSDGWPPFMRVNPILDWSYHDVWIFLRCCKLAYCCLYDRGYTSLGARDNTLPNSALKRDDGTFAPAYLLPDGRLERVGRKLLNTSASDDIPSAFTRSAAIIIIGDEILSGKVEDLNTSYLCQELRSIGWLVVKVVVLPDDVDNIAAEVRAVMECVDVVLTSGGVGPTLDDVTMAGIAQALGKSLTRNAEFESRLRSYFGDELSPAHLKMAQTPEGETDLIDYKLDSGELSKFPLVRCKNVYVLPGIPHLLRQKWVVVKALLMQQSRLVPFRNQVFRLSIGDETRIVPALEAVHQEFGSDILIGSYPVTGQADGTQLLVTLDSKQPEKLKEAANKMRQLLPRHVVVAEQADISTLLHGASQDGPSQNGQDGTSHA